MSPAKSGKVGARGATTAAKTGSVMANVSDISETVFVRYTNRVRIRRNGRRCGAEYHLANTGCTFTFRVRAKGRTRRRRSVVAVVTVFKGEERRPCVAELVKQELGFECSRFSPGDPSSIRVAKVRLNHLIDERRAILTRVFHMRDAALSGHVLLPISDCRTQNAQFLGKVHKSHSARKVCSRVLP